jgi:hypothetical protein
MSFITIRSSNPFGDLLSMLAGIKQVCKDKEKKAIIYQRINTVGVSYQNAEHPYKDENGDPITMNLTMFEKIKPLLEAQDYIERYEIYTGQPFEMDLDKCKLEVFVNAPHGSLARYINHVYPECATDLSRQWLKVNVLKSGFMGDQSFHKKNIYEDKIIINFTFRHRNYYMDYFFLKKYESQLIFAGLPIEHETFCKQWGLEIPLLQDKNFLEFAQILSCCKFFMGNASSNYWIAEALKVPRILEIFPLFPHVIPEGENCYDYYHNQECQNYFDKLLNL